jgi:L-iditol 2-dehydrogenase
LIDLKALMKVRAGEGGIELREVEDPRPGPHGVVLKVERAGVCGSEVHTLHGRFLKGRPPVVLGHEFSGVVEAVGEHVTAWRKGDRVVSETEDYACGHCRFCRSGDTHLCPERVSYGWTVNGGFATYVSVKEKVLRRLPDYISYSEAAVCEPLAVATHAALERSQVGPEETVLVTGPGTIGLLVTQVVKSIGAKVILTGVDSDEARLKLGLELGADYGINTGRQNLRSIVMDATADQGVDRSFECSGSRSAVLDCVRLTRCGGEIIQVGVPPGPTEIPYDEIVLRELTISGTFAQKKSSWDLAFGLMKSRQVKTRPLISGEYPLEKWREVFDRVERREGLKYLLCP